MIMIFLKYILIYLVLIEHSNSFIQRPFSNGSMNLQYRGKLLHTKSTFSSSQPTTIQSNKYKPTFPQHLLDFSQKFESALQAVEQERKKFNSQQNTPSSPSSFSTPPAPATPLQLPPDILVLYSESSPSFFHDKPNHANIIPWKEVLLKIQTKIDYESLNNKYDPLFDGRKPIIKLQTIEEFTTASASVSSFSSVSSIVSSKQQLQQYLAPVIILIGINEQNLQLSTSLDVYLFLHQLSKSAVAVTTFQCDESIKNLEKYGTAKLAASPSLPVTPLQVIQQHWELPTDAISSTAAILAAYSSNTDAETSRKTITQRIFSWLPGFLFRRKEIALKQKHEKVYELLQDIWGRRSLEDLVFGFYILLDTFGNFPIKSVQAVTTTDSTSLSQVVCMFKNCGKEMLQCFMDESCRKALACLNSCKGNDQVCSYRCITSHESPQFEKFAYCILQKHNCMGNKATIPKYPDPQPMTTFRGKPLDFTTADDILIGHLQLRPNEENHLVRGVNDSSSAPLLPWSWKVVCGQNPAYDYFACQHQLFYRDTNNSKFLWYDPVFRVTTFDQEDVWRRRHYKVRRGRIPGQYHFSVIDNGVASNEFWRLLDCADDLSWAVLFYAGAASAAGTSYVGSLIVTPTGRWPEMTAETSERIQAAFQKGEISTWELFEVHNADCQPSSNPPPLQLDYVAN